MNKVILVGRLAQDPEVRYTQSGKAVASFSLAVSRYGGGAQNDTTDFIPIVAWEKLAEICGNNLTKGRRILVEGRLQIRSYEGNDGQNRVQLHRWTDRAALRQKQVLLVARSSLKKKYHFKGGYFIET